MTLLTRSLLTAADLIALALLGKLISHLWSRLLRSYQAAGRAFCGSCGGVLGPVTLAVWAADDGPDDAEPRCRPCHTAARAGNPAPYYPGVTAAPIGPITTRGQFDTAARAAYPDRKHVTCAEHAHDWQPQPGSSFWSECSRCWTPIPTPNDETASTGATAGQENPR